MRSLWLKAGILVALAPAAAFGQSTTIDYPNGSIGTNAILAGDLTKAERQLRESRVSKYDPAKALNLGLVLAKTGRTDGAIKNYRRVLLEDDVQLILANGKEISSHEAARMALANLGN